MGSQRDYYDFMGYPAAELARRYTRYADRLAGAGPVVDVGCGRGDFLALLAERGVVAQGIDLDEDMVAEARERGFEADAADAIEFLRAHEGRFGGVFCAHVIEHLPSEAMVELMRTCAAALVPGGRLIAVTPNPHSLEVQLYEFWTDLQHVRFYTPDIIRWVLHDAGLREVEAADNPEYRSGRGLRPKSDEAAMPAEPGLSRPVPAQPRLRARLRQRLAEWLEPASMLERIQALEDTLAAEAVARADLSAHMAALFPAGEYYVTGVR